ncbi:DUF748 domain-containing protein [Xanthovirga aplysinae]|uniref:DUF748 domain-containing protein n=1 Tax=Xanthovirga aplysinae TaxID=2529853 RepID=UPI0012BD1965|nr:DUF748 domain-containing protein [Xanthovirga aplysinae]MTI32428.1 DUF748 domain-containing protein [Xanthovirga aplysinae]
MKKKVFAVVVILLIVGGGVFLHFLPDISRNYLEKHSNELLGRKLTLKALYFNYFKGEITADTLVLFEPNEKQVFVSFDRLFVDIELKKLLKKEFYFSAIDIQKPNFKVVQRGKQFNFSDIIKRLKEKKKTSEKARITKYSIENLKITDGYFRYRDDIYDREYITNDLDLELPAISWDTQTAKTDFVFDFEHGGHVESKLNLDLESAKYRLELKARDFVLDILTPYLKELMAINAMQGLFGGQLQVEGELEHLANLEINGKGEFKEFHVQDKQNRVPIKFEELTFAIESFDIENLTFYLDSLILKKPEVLLDLYAKGGSNLKELFAFNYVPQKDTSKFLFKKGVDTLTVRRSFVLKTKLLEAQEGKMLFNNYRGGKNLTYRLDSVEIHSEKVNYHSPELRGDLSFWVENGGKVVSKVYYNLNSKVYDLNLELEDFLINQFTPYLKDRLNFTALDGKLTNKVHMAGDLDEPLTFTLSGFNQLDQLSLKDEENVEILSFKQLSTLIDSIDTKNSLCYLQSLEINEPYLKFELFQDRNTYTTLIKEKTKKAQGTKSEEKQLGQRYSTPEKEREKGGPSPPTQEEVFAEERNPLKYLVKDLKINQAILLFYDFTLGELFKYRLDHLNISGKNIAYNNEYNQFNIESNLNQKGHIEARLDLNPNNYPDMRLVYDIYDMDMTDFNPYSVYYTGYPIEEGVYRHESKNRVTSHFLNSGNEIVMRDIKLGNKQKENAEFNLPWKFAISVLRDVEGNVNVSLPVEGNLDDPDFQLGKVVWQAIQNLVTKAVEAPARFLAETFGLSEEKVRFIAFDYLQERPNAEQTKTLDIIAQILDTREGIEVKFNQETDVEEERNRLMIFEAKKRYYIRKNHLDKDVVLLSVDVDKINSIDDDDKKFRRYLFWETETYADETPLIEQCRLLVGDEFADEAVNSIVDSRNKYIDNYLNNIKNIPKNRFVVENVDLKKVDVKGKKVPGFEVTYGAIE